MKPEASLRYIFEEIRSTIYSEVGMSKYRGSADLTRWSEQGVLLLNSALSVQVGKPGAHQLIWRPFIAFLLDMLNWYNPGLIYVFMGQVAAKWADSVVDTNYKLITSHPASAAYNNEIWDGKGVFVKINEHLIKEGKEPIIW